MRGIRILLYWLLLVGLAACEMNDVDSPINRPAHIDQDKEGTRNDKHNEANASLLSPDYIINIAHRGGSAYAPEHTLIAYEIGEQMNGDYIEIDLQMTKDGELVAMHDANVSRTTNGTGNVSDYPLDELKLLDAGSWFPDKPGKGETAFQHVSVPTLKEIFDTFGKKANYYIETKTPDQYPKMVETLIFTLDSYGFLESDIPEDKIIIQSFSKESLLEVKTLAPSLPLVQLLKYDQKASITKEELEHIHDYAIGIGVNYQALTKPFVQKVRDTGLLLHPYTVNEKKEMKRLLDWGVDGIFTNYPDRLDEVIKEQGK